MEQPDKKAQETNEKFKDTFFRKLFRDEKRALELYCAITGEKVLGTVTIYPDDEFWARQNDLAFSVNDRIVVMCEHQSTINPNMPLRLLLNFSQILRSQVVGDRKMYSRKLVEVPTPKFYVLYNGSEKLQNRILKLSDSFHIKEEDIMLEVTARVVDIHWSSDKPILMESPSLAGYAYLISEIKKNIASGVSMDRAIGAAMKSCISNSMLEEFLKENYEEVTAMLNFEYNYETHLEVMKQDGIQEGIQLGKQEGIQKIVATMAKNGMSVEQICSVTEIGEEEVRGLLDRCSQ